MAYTALYRQWRSQDFENLVGQDHITATLANAIRTGKVSHAYLFAGPRGTGKTSTAKILAKALNCVDGPTPTPCNQCSNCEKITQGSSMDVFEIDAASNRGIDEIRDLRETVKFAPVDGRYKIYIIDEVHMLTTEAFNALLKTLEEPPAHVVFVLATTEPHRIPGTIHSRCQRYDFHRIGQKEMAGRLTMIAEKSGIFLEEEGLRLIVAHADGGMRDAINILDQCAAMSGDRVTGGEVRRLLGLVGFEWIVKLINLLQKKDNGAILVGLDELLAEGRDPRQIMLELGEHFRRMMIHKASPKAEPFLVYGNEAAQMEQMVQGFSHEELVEILQTLQEGANDARWATNPRISAEMALLKICRRKDESSEGVANRLHELEQQVEQLSQQLAQLQGQGINIPAAVSVQREKAVVTNKEHGRQVERSLREDPPENKAAVSSAQGSGSSGGMNLADPEKIWDCVLQQLIAEGKRSVHACVAQGGFQGIQDGHAIVGFTASFPKERTEKEDFRGIIEKILAQVTGQELRLRCVMGTGVKSLSGNKGNSVDKKMVSGADGRKPETMPGMKPDTGEKGEGVTGLENHPAVKPALEMFGGKVVIVEKNEEGS